MCPHGFNHFLPLFVRKLTQKLHGIFAPISLALRIVGVVFQAQVRDFARKVDARVVAEDEERPSFSEPRLLFEFTMEVARSEIFVCWDFSAHLSIMIVYFMGFYTLPALLSRARDWSGARSALWNNGAVAEPRKARPERSEGSALFL